MFHDPCEFLSRIEEGGVLREYFHIRYILVGGVIPVGGAFIADCVEEDRVFNDRVVFLHTDGDSEVNAGAFRS